MRDPNSRPSPAGTPIYRRSWPDQAARVRVSPQRHPGLLRRLRRPPRPRLRLLRPEDRDPALRMPRRAGQEHGALCLSGRSVLGRGLRLFPQWHPLDRAHGQGAAPSEARPSAHSRVLAKPSRDLFLHRSTQSRQTTRSFPISRPLKIGSCVSKTANANSVPFASRFGRAALHDLLQRVAAYEHAAARPPTN